MSRSYEQVCPIARTLDLVGDRWTLIILRDLMFGDTKFKELLEHSSGLPTKILSDRLKSLESTGLVERHIYSEHPLRAEYRLTADGRSLGPVLEALVAWGLEHVIDSAERGPVIERIRERTARAAALGSPVASMPGHSRKRPARGKANAVSKRVAQGAGRRVR